MLHAFFLAISHLKVGEEEEHSHCPKNFCKMPRIFFILLLRTRVVKGMEFPGAHRTVDEVFDVDSNDRCTFA